jgi:replication-associated recombination protein RarA
MAERFRLSEQRTRGGHAVDEVASALQKCIRRGLEREAIFWVTELDLGDSHSGVSYGNYAWKRLRVICSEDVGVAWPEGPAVIEALRSTWAELRKAEKDQTGIGNSTLMLVHATVLLARAPKSRIVDNAANVMYAGDRAAMGMEIPNYALDSHTARGRRMGRSEKNHYDESYRLEACELEDPYEQEARMIDGA